MTKKFLIDIHDYKIIKKINSGSYGTVYLVKEKETDENYAAKIIDISKTTKLMINREIGILSRIRHPSLIRFHGYSLTDFDDSDNVTLILQLSPKGSLADLISKVRKKSREINFNSTIRQKILLGIARGMMYLHQHNIIHRDLKPGNVLLNENYEPLITDFGTSKIIANQPDDQTQSVGTSLYMAPEVINSGEYNVKADVFSFAILMYEVVTTSIPYAELLASKISVYKFNDKVIKDHYRPKFKVNVKESIRELIEKCWSADPQQRPSFEEIFNRLAFNMEESICDVFQNEDDEGKYYLPGVDMDEVLSYIDKVNIENENDEEIAQLRKQLIKLERKNEQLTNRVKKLEQENQNMKSQMSELSSTQNSRRYLAPSSSTSSIPSSPAGPKVIKKGSKIEISLSENDDFNGILKYLKINSRDFTTEVEITMSSIARSRHFSPLDIINSNNFNFELSTKDEEHSWIRISFLKHSIIPKGYTIRSTNSGVNGSHPKSWVIEGSADSIDWDILNIQDDCNFLNGRLLTHSFAIENPANDEYKFLRMRQTDCNFYGHNILSINSIEFFGTII